MRISGSRRWLAPLFVLASAAVIGTAAGGAALLRGDSQSGKPLSPELVGVTGPATALLIGRSDALTIAKPARDVAVFVTALPGGPVELVALTGDGGLPRGALSATLDGRRVELGTCGGNCYRVDKPVLQGSPATIAVAIQRTGKPTSKAVVRLPAKLPPSGDAVLTRALRAMHGLRTLRYRETLTGGLGATVVGHFQVQAPDRLRIDSNLDEHIVLIGNTRWTGQKGKWSKSPTPGTRQPAFPWDGPARARVVGRPRIDGGRGWMLAIPRGGPVPVWFELLVAPNGRAREMRMITQAHFMTQSYFGLNRPVSIVAPTG